MNNISALDNINTRRIVNIINDELTSYFVNNTFPLFGFDSNDVNAARNHLISYFGEMVGKKALKDFAIGEPFIPISTKFNYKKTKHGYHVYLNMTDSNGVKKEHDKSYCSLRIAKTKWKSIKQQCFFDITINPIQPVEYVTLNFNVANYNQ
jgi:hypothetical protein